MPLHPDRSGGLGFLANFPGIFSGFVFALSSVGATQVPVGGLIKWMAGAVLQLRFIATLATRCAERLRYPRYLTPRR